MLKGCFEGIFTKKKLQSRNFYSTFRDDSNIKHKLDQPQMPQLNGKNYDGWIIRMKALYFSQDTWNLVENGLAKAADAITYNVLTQEKRICGETVGRKTRKPYSTSFKLCMSSYFQGFQQQQSPSELGVFSIKSMKAWKK